MILVIALASALVGCVGVNVETPESMMKVSKIVDVRLEGERRHEGITLELKALVEDRLRKRGYEIGGSLENWRLDIDLLEIDTTKLQNQRRLVVELRIRAIGPRGEEYFKHNLTEVTPRINKVEGLQAKTHLGALADAIVARVP